MVLTLSASSTAPQTTPFDRLRLIEAVQQFPQDWALTPVKDKRPRRRQWNQEDPLPLAELIRILGQQQRFWDAQQQRFYSDFFNGVALRTGELSHLLAVDLDGESAGMLLREVLEDIPLPPTVSCTSGKHGRQQLFFRISQRDRARLMGFNRAILRTYFPMQTPKCRKGEQLELRYNNCVSVLPPSLHPETGCYQWINSPSDVEIAEAPRKLVEIAHCVWKDPRQGGMMPPTNPANPVAGVRHFPHYRSDARLVDMREIAPNLDGYNEKGRREWATCKCPVHDGCSLDSLHVYRANGAFKAHCGCLTQQVYWRALAVARQRGLKA